VVPFLPLLINLAPLVPFVLTLCSNMWPSTSLLTTCHLTAVLLWQPPGLPSSLLILLPPDQCCPSGGPVATNNSCDAQCVDYLLHSTSLKCTKRISTCKPESDIEPGCAEKTGVHRVSSSTTWESTHRTEIMKHALLWGGSTAGSSLHKLQVCLTLQQGATMIWWLRKEAACRSKGRRRQAHRRSLGSPFHSAYSTRLTLANFSLLESNSSVSAAT
jgi:hypothetical protein